MDSGPVSPRESEGLLDYDPILNRRELLDSIGNDYVDSIIPEQEILPRRKKVENGDEPETSCRDKAITVFGWTFDFVTVAISLIDVVSDILVALQFMRDGHSTWAWLVFGCFINSNIIYSSIITELGFKDTYNEYGYYHWLPSAMTQLPRAIIFIMIFPFAQLSPTLNYIFQTFIMDDSSVGSRGDDRVGNATKLLDDGADQGRGVLQDEQRAVRTDVATMGRLHDALKKQFYTHGLLFAETLVESIPQSIIQLLAITFLGSPSTLQVVSMSLSLLSVVSKGYFVSVSCDIRIFALKFLLVAHDVFSMFYVFCTILSRDGPKEVELFPHSGFKVSWIAYIWFIKIFALAGFVVLAVTVNFLLWIMHDFCFTDRASRDLVREFKELTIAFFAFVFGFIPGLLAAETGKLMWLLFFWVRDEPQRSSLPVAAMSLSFLRGGASKAKASMHRDVQPSEWKARVSYMHIEAYKELLLNRKTYTAMDSVSAQFQHGVGKTRVLNHTARLQMHLERTLLPVLQSDPMTRLQITATHRTFYGSTTTGTAPPSEWERPEYGPMSRDEEVVLDPVMTAKELSTFGTIYKYSRENEWESLTRDELFALPENASVVKKVQALEKELNELVDNGDMTYGERQLRMRCRIIELVYDHGRLLRLHRELFPLVDAKYDVGGSGQDQQVQTASIRFFYVLTFAVEGVSAVLSFVFPFVNFGMYYSTQNVLQQVCFWLLAAALVLVLPLLPAARDYNRWVTQHRMIHSFLGRGHYSYDREYMKVSLERLQQAIVAYHHPTMETLLRTIVEPTLIPPDVSGLAAEFLSGPDVDMAGLTLEDCARFARNE